MSIDKELMDRAHLLAAQKDKEKARLDEEALDLKAKSAKKTERSKIAGTAHERLIQFRQRFGGEVRYCPECFVLRGVASVLEASRAKFIATGDDTLDEFRCRECGYKITVSDWV